MNYSKETLEYLKKRLDQLIIDQDTDKLREVMQAIAESNSSIIDDCLDILS